MTADNGAYVKLVSETDDWTLEFYDSSDKKVNVIAGSQIKFGYATDGELMKTELIGEVKQNETFTGLGEKFNALVQNGYTVTLWNKDSYKENYSENGDKTASYINIPLINSTGGYTLFLNTTYKTVADIANSDKSSYTLSSNGNIFDIYCFTGETKENLNAYTNLTGKSALPPKWAFSYMAGNHGQVWNSTGDAAEYLQNVMSKYNELGTIPSAVYGEYGPEYTDEAYSIVKKYGSRMLGWQDSGVSLAFTKSVFPEFDEDKYPLIRSKSGGYMSGGVSGEAYIDFTTSLGKLLFKNRILSRLNMGWKGGMIDFGDEVLTGSLSYNGISGSEMRNLYPYYYIKGVSEVMNESLGDDWFCYSRTDAAGTQKFMAVFTGDHPSSFQGLKQSLYGGLSLSSTGYSIWGSDLGGMGKSSDSNDADLYRRWLQFSTFNPIMRAHGITDRNPWSYKDGDTDMSDEFVKYYWLRENFVDAIYSSAIKSSIDGTAMTQPLMNEFPNDESLYSVEDEYMFCGELLVAPVTEAEATSREVTLPKGKWVNFWTGETVQGGKTVTVAADKSTIPLFLREGALMPLRLNSDFTFGTSLNDGDIINGLMLTAAADTREATVYKSETESTAYTISAQNGTTEIKADGGSDVRMLVIKGTNAKSVNVDGKTLIAKQSVPSAANNGFKTDGNDTYVYLPEGNWSTITVS